MKKFINAPEAYVDEMMEGIVAAHHDTVECLNGNLRCYCLLYTSPSPRDRG